MDSGAQAFVQAARTHLIPATFHEIAPIFLATKSSVETTTQREIVRGLHGYVASRHGSRQVRMETFIFLLNEIYTSQTIPWFVIEHMTIGAPVQAYRWAAARWPLRCCIMTAMWPNLGFVNKTEFIVIETAQLYMTQAVRRLSLVAALIVTKLLPGTIIPAERMVNQICLSPEAVFNAGCALGVVFVPAWKEQQFSQEARLEMITDPFRFRDRLIRCYGECLNNQSLKLRVKTT